LSGAEEKCPKCDYPQRGTREEQIRYNTRLLKVKDLVEDSQKDVKGILSFAIIFLFMAVVVFLFSLLFNENHFRNAAAYLFFGVLYYALHKLGKKNSYLMAVFALIFYLGHTIYEFSNGMFLKSPVDLDRSFTETRGAALFFALIPMAYLLFRLALMIVLAKYLLTEFRLKRGGKMAEFARSEGQTSNS
jgi:hypothetical protein